MRSINPCGTVHFEGARRDTPLPSRSSARAALLGALLSLSGCTAGEVVWSQVDDGGPADAGRDAVPGDDADGGGGPTVEEIDEHLPGSPDDDTETLETLDDPIEDDFVRTGVEPIIYSAASCRERAFRATEGDPARGVLTVRVRVRIATNASGGAAVSTQRVMSDLRRLNVGFAAAGVRFQLVGAAERLAPDDATYSTDEPPLTSRVRARLVAGGDLHPLRDDAMPIVYVHRVRDAGGFAIPVGPSGCDGVVLSAGNDDFQTVSHELGHALGLSHTHECFNDWMPGGDPAEVESRTGDEIPDTPPDPGNSSATCQPTRGPVLPAARTCDVDATCALACAGVPVAGDVLPRNFMSYYGSCSNRFTPEQIRFMRCNVASDLFAALRCQSGCECGDGICSAGESAASCGRDCGCGNGLCDRGESLASCAADCGAPRCGDGTCDLGEGCPESASEGAYCPADCGATCRGTCSDGSGDCACNGATCDCPTGAACLVTAGPRPLPDPVCITGNVRATDATLRAAGAGRHCGGRALAQAYHNDAVNVGFYPYRATARAEVMTGERSCVAANATTDERPGVLLHTLAPGEPFLRQSARNPRCWDNPPLRGAHTLTERDPRTGRTRRVRYVFGFAPRAQVSGWVEESRITFDGYAATTCFSAPGRFVVSANAYQGCRTLGCTNRRTCRDANPGDSPGQCGGHSVAERDVRTVRNPIALQYSARGEIRAWLHAGDRVRVKYIDANGVAFVTAATRGCRLGARTGWVATWALSEP